MLTEAQLDIALSAMMSEMNRWSMRKKLDGSGVMVARDKTIFAPNEKLRIERFESEADAFVFVNREGLRAGLEIILNDPARTTS